MWNRRFERVLDGIKAQGLMQIIITDSQQIEFITGINTKNEESVLLINSIGKIILAVREKSEIQIPKDIFGVTAQPGENIIFALTPYLQSGSIGAGLELGEEDEQGLMGRRYDTVVKRLDDLAGIRAIMADEIGKTETQLILEKFNS